jgi:hypothetical protein
VAVSGLSDARKSFCSGGEGRVGSESSLGFCTPLQFVAGINPEQNQDGLPITNVGSDGRRWMSE